MSEDFKTFIETLKEDYDYVILTHNLGLPSSTQMLLVSSLIKFFMLLVIRFPHLKI